MITLHIINKRAIKKFLVAGNDVNTLDIDGFTLLQRSIVEGNIPCIQYLLKKAGANPNQYSSFGMIALHVAICYNGLKALKVLLKKGIDIECPIETTKVTPLAYALSISQGADHLKILLEYGAQITPLVHEILNRDLRNPYQGKLAESSVELLQQFYTR